MAEEIALPEELLWLRKALERLDAALLETIAARLNTVKAISKAKRGAGLPVYDENREREARSSLVERARSLGLSRELAEELYTVLVHESRCAQLYCPGRLRVYIYGYGGMARTLASAMIRAGCWVAIGGRSEEKAQGLAEELGALAMEPQRGIDWADMVVYAVPGSAVPGLLEEHLRHARQSMLFTDLASVKKPLVNRIEKMLARTEEPPEYASLHPLFGPLECPAGETVAIVPVRLARWREKLTQLLHGLGMKTVTIDPDTHDRVMAVNQVLHHLVHQLYHEASKKLATRLGIGSDLVEKLMTRSLRQTIQVTNRLATLSNVVEEIRQENPYSHEALSALREAVEKLTAQPRED